MRQSYLTELRTLLRSVRLRWLTARSMRAIGRAGAVACAMLLMVLAIDYLLQPQDLPLMLLATAAVMATIAFAIWAVWPLRRVPSDRQVARFVEERCPELEDRLASAAALNDDAPASPLQDLMLADAVTRARTLDVSRVVSPDDLRRAVVRGSVAAATLVVILAVGIGPVGRMARMVWLYAFPFSVSIDVEPGHARVMAGAPLRIQARLRGSIGAPARTLPRLTVTTDEGPETFAMRPAGDRYEVELAEVSRSFTYRVTAATVSSDEFTVTALVEPHVHQIDVAYVYPAFTGLAPRVEPDSGDVFAPAGTRVTLRVKADKPVVTGAIVLDDGTRLALARQAEADLETSFDVERNGSYRVALVDADGLRNPDSTEYFIRTTFDRPPEIRIMRPDGDREVTPLEEVVIEARAEDDYGVDRFELVYSVVGKGERAIALDAGSRAPTRAGTHTIFTEDLEVAPGDFITYYARARDVGRGAQPTEARSDIFFLEVRAFDQEFEAAQSQGAMAQDATDVANLASVQKEIIVATWKLDRMGAGRDEAGDLRAVAAAQGELKDTAARVAERVQSRGRTSTPENRGRRSPENEAMSAAVEAMAEAQETLEALKTAESLPHEMEALTQLLKAQAEIRRKQVAMSQGDQGASAGMNRAAEDLSQLFDRELRREQQTNYENRARDESRQEQESEALKKVRELAERQAQLKKAQDELADAQADLSAEELARSLQRLTREQNELREKLEELSKQLAGRRERDGRSQAGATNTSEIADEMRRAMNDLRRQNPSQAGARSAQALDGLRDLEQQLRGENDQERQRALGELQLEARQLADAQRRVATTTRQAQAGNSGRDTRYRLAEEEDQLADRVGSLETRIDDLAAQSSPDERETLQAAAEELEREAIGREMRALADRLRQTLTAESPARAGQELARIAAEDERLAGVLDRVAGRLQAAAGPQNAEAQRLSDQLQQAQQLRQSLEQLEQKLDQQGEGSSAPPPPDFDPSKAEDSKPGGQVVQAGADPQPSREGRPDTQREGSRPGELTSLTDLLREIQESPELLDELRQENPGIEQSLADWAQYWASTSAPGTEAFKQDFSGWESLRRDIRLALEAFEASRSQKLLEHETGDRVNAGSDERMPEQYRRLVEKYYEALAQRPDGRR